MADEDIDEPEGWEVRHRPALVAALTILATLLALLIATGFAYDRMMRPRTFDLPEHFPAPGLETAIHDGVEDPRRPPVTARRDPGVEAAKHAIVRDGLPGWGAPR